MNPQDVMEIVRIAMPVPIVIALIIAAGVLANTWLKMKHGYPDRKSVV